MRVRIEGDRANEEATRLIDRLDALLHGSPCSENQRRVMYLVGFTSRSFRGVGTRTLLADQDTGLPQNHSGRKAASRNSGVDCASRGIHKERIQVCFPSVGTLQGPCRAPQGSIWHLHFTSNLPFASSPFTSAPPKKTRRPPRHAPLALVSGGGIGATRVRRRRRRHAYHQR